MSDSNLPTPTQPAAPGSNTQPRSAGVSPLNNTPANPMKPATPTITSPTSTPGSSPPGGNMPMGNLPPVTLPNTPTAMAKPPTATNTLGSSAPSPMARPLSTPSVNTQRPQPPKPQMASAGVPPIKSPSTSVGQAKPPATPFQPANSPVSVSSKPPTPGVAGSPTAKPPSPSSPPSGIKSPTPPTGGKPPMPPSSGQPSGRPSPAKKSGGGPRKPLLRFLPILLIIVAILGLAGFVFTQLLPRLNVSIPFLNRGDTETPVEQPRTQLTYWGLWEPNSVMSEVIADFEQQNPEYQINYIQQNPNQYRERLQTAITQGQGPDIFRFHASWVPMMVNELSAAPNQVITAAEFGQTYYPVAQRQLVINGQVLGIPLMYDGLGLFYNTQILQVANVTPPSDWEEMKQVADTLTVRSGTEITRAGIALGTANNVEHYSDILGLMLYQNKSAEDPQPMSLANVTSQEAQDAIDFYVSFVRDLNVWSPAFPNATETFARGDVAMMIAPSWRAHEVKAKNPNITFAVAPVPQIPGAERVTWASYWAEGVSSQSQHQDVAWKFIKYLSSADVQRKLHSDAKKERAFGEIFSRVDLADDQLSDPVIGAYLEDAPYARSWYMNAATHDAGINDRINKYYEDAVNLMTDGQDAEDVLPTVQQGIEQVLQQYGVSFTPSQPAQITQ